MSFNVPRRGTQARLLNMLDIAKISAANPYLARHLLFHHIGVSQGQGLLSIVRPVRSIAFGAYARSRILN